MVSTICRSLALSRTSRSVQLLVRAKMMRIGMTEIFILNQGWWISWQSFSWQLAGGYVLHRIGYLAIEVGSLSVGSWQGWYVLHRIGYLAIEIGEFQLAVLLSNWINWLLSDWLLVSWIETLILIRNVPLLPTANCFPANYKTASCQLFQSRHLIRIPPSCQLPTVLLLTETYFLPNFSGFSIIDPSILPTSSDRAFQSW